MALIENLQRENLHFFDEAEAYQMCIRDRYWTVTNLVVMLSSPIMSQLIKMEDRKKQQKKESVVHGRIES